MHGSMEANQVLEKVNRLEEERKAKEQKKEGKVKLKEIQKETFLKCQSKCVCGKKNCAASGLKMCKVCERVLKSKCQQKVCVRDGEKPKVLLPACDKKIRVEDVYGDEDEDEENEDEDEDDQSYELNDS